MDRVLRLLDEGLPSYVQQHAAYVVSVCGPGASEAVAAALAGEGPADDAADDWEDVVASSYAVTASSPPRCLDPLSAAALEPLGAALAPPVAIQRVAQLRGISTEGLDQTGFLLVLRQCGVAGRRAAAVDAEALAALLLPPHGTVLWCCPPAAPRDVAALRQSFGPLVGAAQVALLAEPRVAKRRRHLRVSVAGPSGSGLASHDAEALQDYLQRQRPLSALFDDIAVTPDGLAASVQACSGAAVSAFMSGGAGAFSCASLMDVYSEAAQALARCGGVASLPFLADPSTTVSRLAEKVGAATAMVTSPTASSPSQAAPDAALLSAVAAFAVDDVVEVARRCGGGDSAATTVTALRHQLRHVPPAHLARFDAACAEAVHAAAARQQLLAAAAAEGRRRAEVLRTATALLAGLDACDEWLDTLPASSSACKAH